MKSRYLIIILLMLSLTPVYSQPVPDSLWVQGNQLVAGDNFNLAVEAYERILSQGYEHELLYYNLGNAYYRLGQTGLAIWAYEKGLQFDPRHTDLKFNRDVVKTGIKDRIEIPEGFILIDVYRAFKKSLTLRGMLLLASFLLILAGGFHSLNKFMFPDKKLFSSLMVLFIICSVVLHLVLLDKYLELSDKQEGIIIKSVTEAHSTPSGLGKTLFRVHEGLKIEITRIQDDWLEIILLDGKKGWVYFGAVRLL